MTSTALQENDGQFWNNIEALVLCVNVTGNRIEVKRVLSSVLTVDNIQYGSYNTQNPGRTNQH